MSQLREIEVIVMHLAQVRLTNEMEQYILLLRENVNCRISEHDE